jgi:hypothetical protein
MTVHNMPYCPACGSYCKNPRRKENEDVSVKSGFYWSCDCGALTEGSRNGLSHRNLRDDVAALYVKKAVFPTVLSSGYVIRKHA